MVIPLIGVSTYVAEAAWGSWERPAAVLPESYYELVGSAGGRPLLLPPLRTAAGGPGLRGRRGHRRPRRPGPDGRGRRRPGRLRRDGRARGRWGRPRPRRERAGAPGGGPGGRTCRCSPSAGGSRSSISPGAAPCTNTCPTSSGTTGTDCAPSVFGEVKVTTTPDSTAAAIFGASATVLCSHHQSIDRLGAGLTPTAWADDGVIEAVELLGPPFVLGVQWHPEEGGDQRPFAALVEAARAVPRHAHRRRASLGDEPRDSSVLSHAKERGTKSGEAGGRDRRHSRNDGQHLVVCTEAPPEGQVAGQLRGRSTRAGRTSLIEPFTTTSASASISVGAPLTITTTAPERAAIGTRPAAGKTARVDPTHRRRSQRAAASSARRRSAATRLWPKLMVADFKIPPHADPSAVGSRQVGSSSPARTRSWTGSAGWRWSQRRQTISDEFPWISMISPGSDPAF